MEAPDLEGSMISYNAFVTGLHRVLSSDADLNAHPLEQILQGISTVDQLEKIPEGTVVLVRCDLDVPLEDSKVADSSRIEATLATLQYGIQHGWKMVLLGHLGRDPKGSVMPVCKAMSIALEHPIEFVSKWLDVDNMRLLDQAVSAVKASAPGSIFMFENTRQYDIETALWSATDANFDGVAQNMYTLAKDFRERLSDIEVNEALAASNADFSSCVLPLAMSQTALGFYVSTEMKDHIAGARRANFVVVSGAKLTKLSDLEAILERNCVRWIISGGAFAMALKKAQAQIEGGDFFLGRVERDPKAKGFVSSKDLDLAKRIVTRCREKEIELTLPIDFVLDTGEVAEQIPPERAQFDIGPKTRDLLSRQLVDYVSLSKKSSVPFTMFFNGAFGKFEDSKFADGTKDFVSRLRGLTQSGIKTYVGGGEGRMALARFGSVSDVTHAFTAGVTILKSLSDNHVHFLKAMYLNNSESENHQ